MISYFFFPFLFFLGITISSYTCTYIYRLSNSNLMASEHEYERLSDYFFILCWVVRLEQSLYLFRIHVDLFEVRVILFFVYLRKEERKKKRKRVNVYMHKVEWRRMYVRLYIWIRPRDERRKTLILCKRASFFFLSLSLCTFSVLLFCFLIKKKSEQIKKKTETCHNSFVFLFKNIFSTNKTYFNDKSCTTSDKYADTFRFHSATDFIRSASISFVDNRFTKSIDQSHIYSQC